ncbi:MAG: septal ring lytic transglycosylase RlpA family protein [Chthoniobacterales bacterium]
MTTKGIFIAAGLAAIALWTTGCISPSYRGYKHGVYTVRGQTYYPLHPREAIGFEEVGIASHYKEGNWLFAGKTAIGEKLYPNSSGAAHKTLPLPCRIRITNLENGRRTVVRVNDRGPYIDGRIVDVTAPVAKKPGFYKQGLTRVKIEVIDVGDGKYRIRNR